MGDEYLNPELLIYNRMLESAQGATEAHGSDEKSDPTTGIPSSEKTDENELQIIDPTGFKDDSSTEGADEDGEGTEETVEDTSSDDKASEETYTLKDFREFVENNPRVKKALGNLTAKEVFAKIDKDGDGILSEEELSAVSQGSTTLSDITPGEIKKLTKEIQAVTEKEDSEENDKEFEDLVARLKKALGIDDESTTPDTETDTTEVTPMAAESSPVSMGGYSGGGGGVSYGGGGGVSSGSSGGGVQTASTESENALNTLEDVEKAIAEKTTEKETNQTAVNTATDAVTQAQDDKIQKLTEAQDEYEKAQQEYEEALENDEQVSDELKQRQKENSEKITQNEKDQVEKEKELTEKDKAITEKEKEIQDLETQISELDATISALDKQIGVIDTAISDLNSQLNSVSDGTTEEEKTAAEAKRSKIREKITEAEAQKEAANAEKTEAEGKRDEAKEKKETAESEKSDLEDEKKTIEDEIKTLKEDFKTLDEERKEIEDEIKETCSDETKELLEIAQQKREQVQTVIQESDAAIESKKAEAETAKGALDTTINELNELEAKRVELQYKVNTSSYDFDFELNLTDGQAADLDRFEAIFRENEDKYRAVEQATGVPAELVAALHYRESSGDFSTYLHNGEKLGHVTTLVPAGIYFEDWTEAAIDAVKSHGADKVVEGDLQSYYTFAEGYNGWGYRDSHNMNSPYVWSGTNKYTCGKYVADGKFDANAKDQQLGVAVMLQRLLS